MASSITGGGVGAITGPPVLSGEGSPEGVVSAPVGSMYRSTDTGILYVKKTGVGIDDAGWEPVATPADFPAPPTGIGALSYGTSTALTMTLASLASSATAGWQSTAVDNVTPGYVDALLQVRFKLATGTPSVDQVVYLYVYGSEDGTNYTDAITGTSGALTLRNPTNMTLLANYVVQSGGLTFVGAPISVALGFTGIMPRKWGVVIKNTTGLAFTATAGDHAVTYTGIYTHNQ